MIQQGSRLDYHLISFLLQISQYLSPEMEKFPSFLGLKVWDFSSANFCLLRPICIPYKLIKYFTYSTQKFFKWRFEKQEQYRFTILFFYFFFHVTLLESALPLIGIQQKKKNAINEFPITEQSRSWRELSLGINIHWPASSYSSNKKILVLHIFVVLCNHFCWETVNQFLIKSCVFHFQGPHGLPGPKVI